MWRGKQSREKLRSIIAQMMQQQRDTKIYDKEKKKSRKTLTKFLWSSSRRWRSGSKSNLSVDSDNSPTDNSTVITKKSAVRSEAEESVSKSQERRSPYPERRKSKHLDDETDDDNSSSPPIAQLEFMTSKPISTQSLESESGITKQNSWLPPLRSPFTSRPASFRRETSQLSGISGITLSSWESNIERNLRKSGQQQNGVIDEGLENKEVCPTSYFLFADCSQSTPEHTVEYTNSAIDSIPEDRPASVKSRRQSLLLREDSRAHWLPTEVASSRAILVESRGQNSPIPDTPPVQDRSLKRSRTLSSFPTTLAQLTGMGHFLTKQESNRSVSEKDVVVERSSGIIRLGSLDSGNEAVVVDAPEELEIKIDERPSKRFTIAGPTIFSPKTPREIQTSRSRRRTIARGNSDGSQTSGDSPELGLRKRPSVYLHSPSSRSLGHASSSRSILSAQDSPTSGAKVSVDSKHSAESEGSSSGPSKELTASSLQTGPDLHV